jgi:hypothetical protein
MDLNAFKESLTSNEHPAGVSVYLKALWYEVKGDWKQSHDLIQDVPDKNASWIHAYLHRKEGDTWNADYWYSKAGKKRPSVSLEQEWEQIATFFLNGENK